jgi:hypothetical protein
MPDGHRTTTISSIVPLASNEDGVELSYIDTSNDHHSIGSNTNSSHGKISNSITSHFQKIVKKFDCLNVEERGIERILAEDRTDSTIINTAMIWVRNRLVQNISCGWSANSACAVKSSMEDKSVLY